MNNLINLDTDKLMLLEQERQKTMADKDFIQWFKEMRIASRLPKNRKMETDRNHFNTDKINFQFKF